MISQAPEETQPEYVGSMPPMEILTSLGRQLILSESRARDLYEKTKIDQQTGLLNHKTWHEMIQEFVDSEHEEFGVIFIDITHLKPVNDNLGHDVGDSLILSTANILSNSLRHDKNRNLDLVSFNPDIAEGEDDEQDLPAGRLGGDEFGILIDFVDPESTESIDPDVVLESIISRLRDAFNAMILKHPLSADIRRLGFDVAIGGSVWKPHKTASTLLREADQAMYEDKQKYKQERLRSVFNEKELRALRNVRHLLERAGMRTEFLDDES